MGIRVSHYAADSANSHRGILGRGHLPHPDSLCVGFSDAGDQV